ncbi:MAG: hypothetical protein HFE62_03645 [Firmicutes bacterium]|nr:hypothetical protein [Bacillota bacterium]
MKRFAGLMGIIFGILFLSIEIYSLKILQTLEKIHGKWWNNVWGYASEPPCAVALILTVGVIFFSLYIFLTGKDN